MLLRNYLKVVFGLVAIDSIFLTITYSSLLDSSLTPLLLAARIAVDIIFLAFAWSHIKLTKIEAALIFMLVLSCLFATLPGTQHSSSYSISRFFNDVSGPLLFILKVSALRSLFRQDNSALNIKKLSRALIILSTIQVLIFIYFSAQSGAYAGITPPINIPGALYIATFNYLGLAATVILIALSGKRSFLISVALVSSLSIILRGSHRNKLVFLTILTAIVSLFFVLGNEKINATVVAASEFFDMTEIQNIDLYSEQVRSDLYFLTGGRSEEFYGILREMQPLSWIIGLGPGFTYGYLYVDGLVEGYANAHFSPLSLTYKFGAVYALLFYAYLAGNIRTLLNISHPHSFVIGCTLSIFLLQSFFAFNLYAEPYLPIFLALGMIIPRTSKKKKVHAFDHIRIKRLLNRRTEYTPGHASKY